MYASIPFIGEPTDLFKVHESFEFNGHVYHDVFEFANEGQDLQGIYIETVYYNYKKGVIAIMMSNSSRAGVAMTTDISIANTTAPQDYRPRCHHSQHLPHGAVLRQALRPRRV